MTFDIQPLIKEEQIEARIQSTTKKWLKELEAKGSIEEKVEAALQGELERVTRKVLGLDIRWHNKSWEVDHCNGRSGNSIVGDALQERAVQRFAEVIGEAATKIDFSDMEAHMIKELERSIRRNLDMALKRYAEAKAAELWEGFLEEYERKRAGKGAKQMIEELNDGR